jgi:peptide deformylase
VRYAGTGLLARCLQHETDHTKGTVFGDRLNRRAYKKLQKQMEAADADYPLDWPAGSSSSADGSS